MPEGNIIVIMIFLKTKICRSELSEYLNSIYKRLNSIPGMYPYSIPKCFFTNLSFSAIDGLFIFTKPGLFR